MLILPLLGCLLAPVARVLAASSTGDSVLVILEPSLNQTDYSRFFAGLEDRGFELTFRAPKESEPALFLYDDPQFAHVILFAPTTKGYAKDITPQALVRLLAAGTNLLVALSPAQTPLTALAAEFGLVLPPPGTPLLSHFPARPPPHTTVPVPVDAAAAHGILAAGTPPLLFAGVPHRLADTPQLVPIVRAPAESFAADAADDTGADALTDAAERGGEGLWAGAALGLISGFQARGGARAAWVGGIEVFSDAFAGREVERGVVAGNARVVQDVARWAFQESLVLRIDNTTHRRAGESAPRTAYTTNDPIEFTMHVSAFDAAARAWRPHAGLGDAQLAFTMLDPHVRTALRAVPGAPGRYAAAFRAPDRHGVFKFVVDYRRRGLTALHSETVVAVVPPRHDGYPRFLSAAWPYYAGALSTSAAFVVFCALWLGGAGEERKRHRAKAE